MNARFSPLAMILLAVLLVAAFALSIVNLQVAFTLRAVASGAVAAG